jgi:hypothetical protein
MALCMGCTHGPVRPDDPARYRSEEGYGDARWGMTPAELSGRLADARQLDAQTYQRHEIADGRPAWVTYAFPNGQLASVTVQFDPPAGQPADFDATYDMLAHRFGDPLPAPGARDAERDAALTVAAIVAAVLVVGILVALVAKGHGGGGGGHVASGGVHAATAIHAVAPPVGVFHPVRTAWWIDLAAVRLTADALHLAVLASAPGQPAPPQPAGAWMQEWRTGESDVLLLGLDLGAPSAQLVLTYRSLALNPPPPTD